MIAFAYYLLKVTVCSGLLCGYYWWALRNKTFHQWNRFYLLVCLALSLLAPLLKIQVGNSYASAPTKVFRLLHVIDANSEIIVESRGSSVLSLTAEQYLLLAYTLISTILLFIIITNTARICVILRSFPKTKIGNIYFLNTDARGTPFSFFHYIVWNRNIDMETETGRRIFSHELAHMQQRHTWDKVFLLLLLIPFWINPFFWIIRKELAALHEFAADKKAMEQQDVSALAQLILNTAFPQQHFLFTNSFFQSTIKRRIAMFTKLKNPTVSYFSRILALPVLLFVIASFALKTVPLAAKQNIALDKAITVVIDAGHGDKSGARIENIYEDAIVLSIARKIKGQNKNSKVNIILTRESDQVITLDKRVQIAAENKADLFISIHADISVSRQKDGSVKPTNESGIHIQVPSKNPPYQQQSQVLGSVLVKEFASAYNTQTDLIKTGAYVLNNNVCPSVLIECGYLTNKKDRDYITQDANQIIIANKILDAIERYGVLKNTGTISSSDTLPKLNNKSAYIDTKQDLVIEADSIYNSVDPNNSKVNTKTALIIINEKKVRNETIFRKTIIAKNLKIIEAKEAIKEFGKEAANGAIVIEEAKIIDKPASEYYKVGSKVNEKDKDKNMIFTKTEVEPTFPKENGGWQQFLQKNLNADVPLNKEAPTGTYKVMVQFIVDEAGKLSDIKPLTTNRYGMEEEVVRLMKISPDWIPAKQNGRNVTAYKKQTVTFVISEG